MTMPTTCVVPDGCVRPKTCFAHYITELASLRIVIPVQTRGRRTLIPVRIIRRRRRRIIVRKDHTLLCNRTAAMTCHWWIHGGMMPCRAAIRRRLHRQRRHDGRYKSVQRWWRRKRNVRSRVGVWRRQKGTKAAVAAADKDQKAEEEEKEEEKETLEPMAEASPWDACTEIDRMARHGVATRCFEKWDFQSDDLHWEPKLYKFACKVSCNLAPRNGVDQMGKGHASFLLA